MGMSEDVKRIIYRVQSQLDEISFKDKNIEKKIGKIFGSLTRSDLDTLFGSKQYNGYGFIWNDNEGKGKSKVFLRIDRSTNNYTWESDRGGYTGSVYPENDVPEPPPEREKPSKKEKPSGTVRSHNQLKEEFDEIVLSKSNKIPDLLAKFVKGLKPAERKDKLFNGSPYEGFKFEYDKKTGHVNWSFENKDTKVSGSSNPKWKPPQDNNGESAKPKGNRSSPRRDNPPPTSDEEWNKRAAEKQKSLLEGYNKAMSLKTPQEREIAVKAWVRGLSQGDKIYLEKNDALNGAIKLGRDKNGALKAEWGGTVWTVREEGANAYDPSKRAQYEEEASQYVFRGDNKEKPPEKNEQPKEDPEEKKRQEDAEKKRQEDAEKKRQEDAAAAEKQRQKELAAAETLRGIYETAKVSKRAISEEDRDRMQQIFSETPFSKAIENNILSKPEIYGIYKAKTGNLFMMKPSANILRLMGDKNNPHRSDIIAYESKYLGIDEANQIMKAPQNYGLSKISYNPKTKKFDYEIEATKQTGSFDSGKSSLKGAEKISSYWQKAIRENRGLSPFEQDEVLEGLEEATPEQRAEMLKHPGKYGIYKTKDGKWSLKSPSEVAYEKLESRTARPFGEKGWSQGRWETIADKYFPRLSRAEQAAVLKEREKFGLSEDSKVSGGKLLYGLQTHLDPDLRTARYGQYAPEEERKQKDIPEPQPEPPKKEEPLEERIKKSPVIRDLGETFAQLREERVKYSPEKLREQYAKFKSLPADEQEYILKHYSRYGFEKNKDGSITMAYPAQVALEKLQKYKDKPFDDSYGPREWGRKVAKQLPRLSDAYLDAVKKYPEFYGFTKPLTATDSYELMAEKMPESMESPTKVNPFIRLQHMHNLMKENNGNYTPEQQAERNKILAGLNDSIKEGLAVHPGQTGVYKGKKGYKSVSPSRWALKKLRKYAKKPFDTSYTIQDWTRKAGKYLPRLADEQLKKVGATPEAFGFMAPPKKDSYELMTGRMPASMESPTNMNPSKRLSEIYGSGPQFTPEQMAERNKILGGLDDATKELLAKKPNKTGVYKDEKGYSLTDPYAWSLKKYKHHEGGNATKQAKWYSRLSPEGKTLADTERAEREARYAAQTKQEAEELKLFEEAQEKKKQEEEAQYAAKTKQEAEELKLFEEAQEAKAEGDRLAKAGAATAEERWKARQKERGSYSPMLESEETLRPSEEKRAKLFEEERVPFSRGEETKADRLSFRTRKELKKAQANALLENRRLTPQEQKMAHEFLERGATLADVEKFLRHPRRYGFSKFKAGEKKEVIMQDLLMHQA